MGYLGGGGGAPTSGGSRFDVRRFGAQGTGTSDDAAAIQAAIDAAIASGVEMPTVFFPQGAYLIGQTLSVSAPLQLIGESATLRLGPGASCIMVDGIDAVRGGMSGLILDGQADLQTGNSPGIRLVNCAYFTLADCTIRHAAGHGVVVANDQASVMADEGRIERCYIQQNRGLGIHFVSTGDVQQGVGDWLIHACHIDANGQGGLRFDLGSSNIVSDCNVLSNDGPGVRMAYNVGTIVTACQIRNNRQEGVWLEDCEDGLLDGCQVHLNARDPETGFSGVKLERCRGMRIEGLYVGDAFIGPVRQTYGVQAENCRGLTLIGNVCRSADHLLGGWAISADQVGIARANIGFPNVGASEVASTENGYEYTLGLGRLQVSDSASLAVGLSDFTLGLRVRLPSWRPSQMVTLVDKAASPYGLRLRLTSAGFLQLELGDGTAGMTAYDSTEPVEHDAADTAYVAVSVDRDGLARFTLDGRAVGAPVDVSAHAAISLTSSAALQIGSNGTTHDPLQVTALHLFNYAMTPAEVFRLARGGVVEVDRWASFAPWKVSDFSTGVDGFGSSNGTLSGNMDGVSDGATTHDDALRFYCNSSDITHRVNLAMGFLAARHRLRFRYLIPSGTGLDGIAVTSSSDPAGTSDVQLLATVGVWTLANFELRRAAGTSTQVWRWVARKSGSFAFAGANDSAQDLFYLRDVEATALGCVLALEGTYDAVNHFQWQDASPNWNDATADVNGVAMLRARTSGRVRGATAFEGSQQLLGQVCLPTGANPTSFAVRKSGSAANRSVGSSSGGTQYINAQSVGTAWSRPTQTTTVVHAAASSIFVTAADADRTEIEVRYQIFG